MPSIGRRSGDEPVDPNVQLTTFQCRLERVYRCDPTSAGFDAHLPTASGVGGKDVLLYAEHDGGNDITIVPSGIETIAGQPNLVLTARQAVILTSNGVSDWMKFGV